MVASWSPAMYWKDCWSLEWQDSGLRRQGRETGSELYGGDVEDLSQRELRLFMECGTSLAKQRKAKVKQKKTYTEGTKHMKSKRRHHRHDTISRGKIRHMMQDGRSSTGIQSLTYPLRSSSE